MDQLLDVEVARVGARRAHLHPLGPARPLGDGQRRLHRRPVYGAVVPKPRSSARSTASLPVAEGWFVVNAGETRMAGGPGARLLHVVRRSGPAVPRARRRPERPRPGRADGDVPRRRTTRKASSSSPARRCSSIEGEERPLRTWDFVHCPPWTEHVILGAGDGPCIVLGVRRAPVGTRVALPGERGCAPPRRGADEETSEPSEAYAGFPDPRSAPAPEALSWTSRFARNQRRHRPALGPERVGYGLGPPDLLSSRSGTVSPATDVALTPQCK